MKKEYVKPQNRVVILKDKLMQIGQGSDDDNPGSKIHYEDDSDENGSPHDVWED